MTGVLHFRTNAVRKLCLQPLRSLTHSLPDCALTRVIFPYGDGTGFVSYSLRSVRYTQPFRSVTRESKLTASVPMQDTFLRKARKDISAWLRSVLLFAGRKQLQLVRAQYNKSHRLVAFVILCSHQGSNLDRRYRKPTFYPLNYESKFEDHSMIHCSFQNPRYSKR